MMPPCGTFDYVATVGDRSPDGQFVLQASMFTKVRRTNDRHLGDRLVGLKPLMTIEDAEPGPKPGRDRASVLRSRISFQAVGRKRAQVREFSFYVDRALISRLDPGDVVHVARSASGGLGLSILRDGRLAAALGALNVPMGPDVSVRIPGDLVERAAAIFAERAPGFMFHEWPIEIRIGDFSTIQIRGSRKLDNYRTIVIYGYRPGIPGKDMCAAIYDWTIYDDKAVRTSVRMLDGGGTLVEFDR